MIRPWKISSLKYGSCRADRIGPPGRYLIHAWATALAAVPVNAQRSQGDTPIDLPALAYFTPDDVKLFVEIDNLPEISARIRDSDLWPMLVQLLGGGESSWPDGLAESLGVGSNVDLLRLFSERVALAAPDWRRIGDGVILFRQSSSDVREQITKSARARRGRFTDIGPTNVMQSKTGLWIAISESTVVLSHKQGDGTLFNRCIELLNGRDGGALAASTDFRNRVAGLASPRNGCAYWVVDPVPATATTRPATLAGWWAPLSSGAMSVRVLGHQLELAFRGPLDDRVEGAPRYQPRVLQNRITSLPQGTLAVWATSIDAREMFGIASEIAPPAGLEHLWEILRTGVDASRFQDDVIANIGPRCIVIAAADYTTSDLVPQLGFMIESVDGAAVAGALSDIARQVAGAVGAANESEPSIGVSSFEHLDTTIHEMRLSKTAIDADGDSLASLIVGGMTPSFAEVKGWIVISTSPNHIRQIVDAGNGLMPRLGDLLAGGRNDRSLNRSVSAAVIQPSLALGTFRYWSDILRERRALKKGTRLGISVRTEGAAGMVIIADVQSNGPSADLLRPDDALIACNDRLLPMDAANDALKTMLAQAPGGAPLRLRLLRDGEIHEVSIEAPTDPLPIHPDAGMAAVMERLAPLQELLMKLTMAVYAEERPSDGVYAAELLLEFERPSGPASPMTDGGTVTSGRR